MDQAGDGTQAARGGQGSGRRCEGGEALAAVRERCGRWHWRSTWQRTWLRGKLRRGGQVLRPGNWPQRWIPCDARVAMAASPPRAEALECRDVAAEDPESTPRRSSLRV